MPNLVTAGSPLRCSKGLALSILQVPLNRGVSVGGQTVACAPDCRENLNILPFGRCISASNPYRNMNADAPCVPKMAAQWTPASVTVSVGGLAVVNTASQCQCQFGGVVTPVSGQPTVSAG